MSKRSNPITVFTPPKKPRVDNSKTDNILLNTPSTPFMSEMEKSVNKVTSCIDSLSLTPLQNNSTVTNVEFLHSQSLYTVISSSGIEYRSLHDSPAGLCSGNKDLNNRVEKMSMQHENQKSTHRKAKKGGKGLDNILKMILDSEENEIEEIEMPSKLRHCGESQKTKSTKTNLRPKSERFLNEKDNFVDTCTMQNISYDNNICNKNSQIVNNECYIPEDIFTAQTQLNSQNLEMMDTNKTKNSEYQPLTNIFSDETSFSQCLTIVGDSCESLNDSLKDNNDLTISPTTVIARESNRLENKDNIVTSPLPDDRSTPSQSINDLADIRSVCTLNITPPIADDRPIKWKSPTIVLDSDLSESAATVNDNADATVYDTSANNNLSPDLFDEDDNTNFPITNERKLCNESEVGELLSNYSDEYVDTNIKRRFTPADYNDNAVQYAKSDFLREFLVDDFEIFSNIQGILGHLNRIDLGVDS